MISGRFEELFDVYQGKVQLDGQEYNIPVLAGAGIPEVLIGLQWLKTLRLMVDFPKGVLTLEESLERSLPQFTLHSTQGRSPRVLETEDIF